MKAGGDLSKSRLKGAISAKELLSPGNFKDPSFLEVDPKDGFSVRNFQIQAAKMALVSDIVVYGDSTARLDDVHNLAKRIARAQGTHRERLERSGVEAPKFSTFVVSSMFWFPIRLCLTTLRLTRYGQVPLVTLKNVFRSWWLSMPREA